MQSWLLFRISVITLSWSDQIHFYFYPRFIFQVNWKFWKFTLKVLSHTFNLCNSIFFAFPFKMKIWRGNFLEIKSLPTWHKSFFCTLNFITFALQSMLSFLWWKKWIFTVCKELFDVMHKLMENLILYVMFVRHTKSCHHLGKWNIHSTFAFQFRDSKKVYLSTFQNVSNSSWISLSWCCINEIIWCWKTSSSKWK